MPSATMVLALQHGHYRLGLSLPCTSAIQTLYRQGNYHHVTATNSSAKIAIYSCMHLGHQSIHFVAVCACIVLSFATVTRILQLAMLQGAWRRLCH